MEDVSVGILAEKCNATCTMENWSWKENKIRYWSVHHFVKTALHMESLHWEHNFDRKFLAGRITSFKKE